MAATESGDGYCDSSGEQQDGPKKREQEVFPICCEDVSPGGAKVEVIGREHLVAERWG